MTWFKVDDKFHSHRKIAALGTDAAALSLWVVAGSWSADQLTDGWIPEYIVPRLLPVSKVRAFRFASALELCGLWDRSEPDSEPGWQFHGWNDRGRQPTSAQVLADREANAVRQAAFQERKKADRNGVANGVMNGVANEAPTRPDPTPKKLPTADAVAADAQLELIPAVVAAVPKPATAKHAPADALAAKFWEIHKGSTAQSFLVIRGIVRTALGNGLPRDDVARALDRLAQEGRAISGGSITTALAQIRGVPGANGHTPWRNPEDQSDYYGEI